MRATRDESDATRLGATVAERERCARIADQEAERHRMAAVLDDLPTPEEAARRRGYTQGYIAACATAAERIRSGE